MTIEDLYLAILKNKNLAKIALFDAYVTTYEAWISSPNEEKLLEALYKILKDLEKNYSAELTSICTVSVDYLDIPKELAQPDWIATRNIEMEERGIVPNFKILNELKNSSKEQLVDKALPSLTTQAGNLADSLLSFVTSGFKTVTEEQYKERRAICESCQFFDPSGFGGLGRCRKCGCSSYKLNMAVSECPFGFWKKIE